MAEHNALGVATQAEYVQTLTLLCSQRSVTNNRAALTMLIPGSRGIYLHAQGSDSRSADKLLQKKEALAERLRIPPGEDWPAESPEYQAGAAALRASNVHHYERIIEGQVFKCKQIIEKLRKESPGKNAVRLEKSLITARKCVLVVLRRGRGAPGVGCCRLRPHTANHTHVQEHQEPSRGARHLAGFRRDTQPCRRGLLHL
jgi:hypothetical protein